MKYCIKIYSFSIILFYLLTVPCYSAEKTYILKFNTIASHHQPQVKALHVFAEVVDRLSAGKIKVRIFHSGQLGNQQSQLTSVMRGTIDMTFTTPNFLSRFDKSVGIFGAAYLFRDLDHMYRVMLGPLGQKYFEKMAKELGVRPLDVWYLGTRQLNLRDKGVHMPEEMRGIKLRMPNSPLWIAMGRALGANPTPLGFGEVYMGLKTGVVDGQDNPLPTNKAQKFYEVTRYLILTDHQIGMLWPSIHEGVWKNMPEKYKMWIKKAIEIARYYQNYLVMDGEVTLLREFEKKYGIKIIHPDIQSFQEHARKVYQQFERDWGKDMYDKIRTYP